MVQGRFDFMGSHRYLRSVPEGHPDVVFAVNHDVAAECVQAVFISFPLSLPRS